MRCTKKADTHSGICFFDSPGGQGLEPIAEPHAGGRMISIDCTRVENEVARNMYEASELDWLVYNAPVDYVDLLLHGDILYPAVQ